MRSTFRDLQRLATRTGAGDHEAFRRLYRLLAPDTLAALNRHLPDPGHSMHVVRATFCEVWWMCAFDVRCGAAHPANIPQWIAAVARRRGEERCRALLITKAGLPLAQQDAFWAGVLAEQDQWARFELATMLDGHDTIGPRPAAVISQRQKSQVDPATYVVEGSRGQRGWRGRTNPPKD